MYAKVAASFIIHSKIPILKIPNYYSINQDKYATGNEENIMIPDHGSTGMMEPNQKCLVLLNDHGLIGKQVLHTTLL